MLPVPLQNKVHSLLPGFTVATEVLPGLSHHFGILYCDWFYSPSTSAWGWETRQRLLSLVSLCSLCMCSFCFTQVATVFLGPWMDVVTSRWTAASGIITSFFFFLIYAIYGSEIKTKSPAFLHSYLSVYLFYISLLFTFVNLFLLGILRLKYHGRFCFASQSGNLFSFYKLVKCIAFIDITNEFGFSSVYCTSHTRHMHVIITHILTATSLCVRFTTWSALFSLFLDMFWKLGRFVFLF